jgi:hypothetical protein
MGKFGSKWGEDHPSEMGQRETSSPQGASGPPHVLGASCLFKNMNREERYIVDSCLQVVFGVTLLK